jgi:ribonuclease PH
MRQAAITACMFELIEALDLVFEDDSARKNAMVIRGHKTAEEINETQNKVRG